VVSGQKSIFGKANTPGTRQPVSAQLVATSYRELLNLYCSRTLVTTSPGTSPTPWNTRYTRFSGLGRIPNL
jgi:hypothetical protein